MGVGGQKESAEWVNMVLHKIWKVYRRSLEAWLVGLLQPAIDTLPLPSVVSRVRIAEFSLDFEPLSVRNVQRRASRRANDLQYVNDYFCFLVASLPRSLGFSMSRSWRFGGVTSCVHGSVLACFAIHLCLLPSPSGFCFLAGITWVCATRATLVACSTCTYEWLAWSS